MLSNIILILIAVLVLSFIGLLWARQTLMSIVHKMEAMQMVLQKDLQKRRDTVPYLLESIKQLEEPSDMWRKIVEDRAVFHQLDDMQKEKEFEKELLDFLNSLNFKNVDVLEAKKDILDLTQIIEREKGEIALEAGKFNALKMEFPYSLASAIFGFKEIIA